MRGLLEEPNDGIALTLTTTGSSGASTYNPATGDLNIPIYSGGAGGTHGGGGGGGGTGQNPGLGGAGGLGGVGAIYVYTY